jgi:hypothetical protein
MLPKPLLLKFILYKKIIESAKRESISSVEMKNYEDIYAAPRQNLLIPNKVTSRRGELTTTRQGNKESVQS